MSETATERTKRAEWLRRNVALLAHCEHCGAEIDKRTGTVLDSAFWESWAKREHEWVHRLEDEIAELRRRLETA